MELTTVNAVKDLLGVATGDTDDDAIQQLVNSVSGEIETFLNRKVTAAAIVEQVDVKLYQFMFLLKAYPVTSVTDIRNDWDRVFPTGTILPSADYYVDLERGVLYTDRAYGMVTGIGVLKISYTGGMAANTVAFIAAYPDISGACAMECAYRYQRRAHIGVTNISVSGTNVSFSSKTQFLPAVENVLYPHCRIP